MFGESWFHNRREYFIDGGMTRQMIYHNDCGWTLEEK